MGKRPGNTPQRTIVTRSVTRMETKNISFVVGIAGNVYQHSKPCFMAALGLIAMGINKLEKYQPPPPTTEPTPKEEKPEKGTTSGKTKARETAKPETSSRKRGRSPSVKKPTTNATIDVPPSQMNPLKKTKQSCDTKKAQTSTTSSANACSTSQSSDKPKGTSLLIKSKKVTKPSTDLTDQQIKLEIGSSSKDETPAKIIAIQPPSHQNDIKIKKEMKTAIVKSTCLAAQCVAQSSQTVTKICSEDSSLDAILAEQIIIPLQKSIKNASRFLKDYNPNMARDLVSTQQNSGKENQSCRISRAKATAHEADLLQFCQRMEAHYSVLHVAINKHGGTDINQELSFYYFDLVSRISKNQYDPTVEEINEQLAKRNPNMARTYHKKSDSKTNNDAVIRCRAKKAIKKVKLQEAADELKFIVESLKEQYKKLRSTQ